MRCYAEQYCTLFSDDLEPADLFDNEVIEQVYYQEYKIKTVKSTSPTQRVAEDGGY